MIIFGEVNSQTLSYKNRIDKLDDSLKFEVNCNSSLGDSQITDSIKILKFTSCKPHDIFNSDFVSIINNSSWIFIVTIEGSLTEYESFMRNSSFNLNQIERQLLVQVYDEEQDKEEIFVARNSKHENALQITKLAKNPSILSKNSTIDLLLLHVATTEHHKSNKKFDYSNWIIQSLRNACNICIRFAQLVNNQFIQDLKLYGDQIEGLHCDKNCFRSLLNLPFNFEFNEVSSEIIDYLQDNYITQLTKAKAQALKIGQKITLDNFLNESQARMNLEGLSALAWSQNEFKIFNFLIRADLPYPQNYQKNDKNLKFTAVEELHKNIQAGNFEKVKEFIKSNKMLTFARNSNNTSALQMAFEYEQFEIFSYLRSHGMMLSDINEMGKHYSQRSNLSEIKKKKIRQFNMKNVMKVGEFNLIDGLLQQSSITFNRRKLSKEKLKLELRKAFMDLNELVPDILRVVAANDHFEMIFDFDNDAVDDMDPRQTDNAGSAFRNYALIGALNLMSKNKNDRDFALSTIAHEIMHSAMGLIYGNDMNPYSLGDNESLSKMTLIANQCRQLMNQSSIINSAFKDNDKNLHIELIARVPDMILTYRNNQSKLKRRQKTFKSLFDFYENKIIKDIQAMHSTMSARIKVKEFNNWLGVVDLLHRLDENTLTNYKDEEIAMEKDTKVHIFITNHVRSMLRKIYEKAMREKELVVFLKSSFATHEYFKDALYEIDRIKADVLLVIYCDSNFPKLKEFQERVDSTTLERVVFVGREESKSELLKLNFKNKAVKFFN